MRFSEEHGGAAERCRVAFGLPSVVSASSPCVRVPAAIGSRSPIIALPDGLLGVAEFGQPYAPRGELMPTTVDSTMEPGAMHGMSFAIWPRSRRAGRIRSGRHPASNHPPSLRRPLARSSPPCDRVRLAHAGCARPPRCRHVAIGGVHFATTGGAAIRIRVVAACGPGRSWRGRHLCRVTSPRRAGIIS